MKNELKAKFILLIVLIGWILFLFSEPIFFDSKAGLILYPFVKKGTNLICHQEEYKLIEFFGYHSLVCTRCTGLYLGVLIGLVISFFLNIKTETNHKLFFTSVVIIILDIIFYDYLSIYSYNKIIAFFSGLFLGSTVFNYFYGSLISISAKD